MSLLRLIRHRVVLVAGVVAAVALSASAQVQEQFVPLSQLPDQQEVLPATPFVFIAYAFVWVALIVYVGMLWRRLSRVEHELQDVRRRLTDRGGARE